MCEGIKVCSRLLGLDTELPQSLLIYEGIRVRSRLLGLDTELTQSLLIYEGIKVSSRLLGLNTEFPQSLFSGIGAVYKGSAPFFCCVRRHQGL